MPLEDEQKESLLKSFRNAFNGGAPDYNSLIGGQGVTGEEIIENTRAALSKMNEDERVYVLAEPFADGNTAIHFAALNGNLELTELLVENGADLNAKNSKGKTPIAVASDANRGWGGAALNAVTLGNAGYVNTQAVQDYLGQAAARQQQEVAASQQQEAATTPAASAALSDGEEPVFSRRPKGGRRRDNPLAALTERNDVPVVKLQADDVRPKGTKFGVAIPMGEGPGGFDQSVLELARRHREERLAREAEAAEINQGAQRLGDELSEQLARRQERITTGAVADLVPAAGARSGAPQTELQQKLARRQALNGEAVMAPAPSANGESHAERESRRREQDPNKGKEQR